MFDKNAVVKEAGPSFSLLDFLFYFLPSHKVRQLFLEFIGCASKLWLPASCTDLAARLMARYSDILTGFLEPQTALATFPGIHLIEVAYFTKNLPRSVMQKAFVTPPKYAVYSDPHHLVEYAQVRWREAAVAIVHKKFSST